MSSAVPVSDSRALTPYSATPASKVLGEEIVVSGVFGFSRRIGVGSSASAAAESSAFDLQKGDRVMHRVFGEGTILNVTPMGGDHMVEVRFPKGVKKIMAAFARLQKLS